MSKYDKLEKWVRKNLFSGYINKKIDEQDQKMANISKEAKEKEEQDKRDIEKAKDDLKYEKLRARVSHLNKDQARTKKITALKYTITNLDKLADGSLQKGLSDKLEEITKNYNNKKNKLLSSESEIDAEHKQKHICTIKNLTKAECRLLWQRAKRFGHKISKSAKFMHAIRTRDKWVGLGVVSSPVTLAIKAGKAVPKVTENALKAVCIGSGKAYAFIKNSKAVKGGAKLANNVITGIANGTRSLWATISGVGKSTKECVVTRLEAAKFAFNVGMRAYRQKTATR
ncbi:MAG: hypothetical protein IJ184_01860 [Alphaproteobacteria bacterium]|nr:hypothetical protein [Alphaproteobacteria bacterium]